MSNFKYVRPVLPSEYFSWEDMIIDGFDKAYIRTKKAIVCDCDGILTDGNLSYTKEGKFIKTYGCHDKEMISLVRKLGWNIHFVTNDASGIKITEERLYDSLKLPVLQENSFGRAEHVKKLVNEGYLTIFCGDSPSDLKAAANAHYCCTTKNCFEPIKKYFNYVSEYEGGHGGLADILYKIIIEGKDILKYVEPVSILNNK